MKLLITFFCLLAPLGVLCSAVQVKDGDHVFIYDDGLFTSLADAAKKELAEDLKKRKIKWSSKSVKGGLLADINNDLEKNVLKKKPTAVVLSFGINDICDPKKLTLNEYDIEALKESLSKAVKTLKDAGIAVAVATPGLAGEDLEAEHQAAIDELATMITAFAAEHKTGLCKVRSKAVDWVKNNPPKKKGRLQISKKGGKWDKKGVELLSSSVMSSIGMSKSGIKRALRWDEKIVLASAISVWQSSVEKELEPEIRAAGPKEAPKGFFNPGVKGPDYIHIAIGDLDSKAFEDDRFMAQKPTVGFIQMLYRLCIHLQYQPAKAQANLDSMMEVLAKKDFPVFVFTPMWFNESGVKALGKKGPTYERCKELADMIKVAAAKHAVPVIDLFSLCEQEHAKDPSKTFFGPYGADPKQYVLGPDGKVMMKREIKRVLGILKEE